MSVFEALAQKADGKEDDFIERLFERCFEKCVVRLGLPCKKSCTRQDANWKTARGCEIATYTYCSDPTRTEDTEETVVLSSPLERNKMI